MAHRKLIRFLKYAALTIAMVFPVLFIAALVMADREVHRTDPAVPLPSSSGRGSRITPDGPNRQ